MGELLGKCVKYNQFFYLFMPSFLELTYRSDWSADFSALCLKRCGLVQVCAFLGFVDIAAHLGGQIPPPPKTRTFGP